MSLTTVLQNLAVALANDSQIESICTSAWGRSLTVYRRVGELHVPEADRTPMVQIQSGTRSRDGHYVNHGLILAVFAGGLAEPVQTGQVVASADEADAEALAERVEVVAQSSFDAQGVAASPAEGEGDVITGPFFVAAYSYVITLKNVIPL
jgi:hypothetical protein